MPENPRLYYLANTWTAPLCGWTLWRTNIFCTSLTQCRYIVCFLALLSLSLSLSLSFSLHPPLSPSSLFLLSLSPPLSFSISLSLILSPSLPSLPPLSLSPLLHPLSLPLSPCTPFSPSICLPPSPTPSLSLSEYWMTAEWSLPSSPFLLPALPPSPIYN